MNNCLISVIITYYKKKKYISETINSILNQTYNNWVLIVGDDFSDDTKINKFIKDKVREINDTRYKIVRVTHSKWFKKINQIFYNRVFRD